jgi:type I restriction enzyme S subunit
MTDEKSSPLVPSLRFPEFSEAGEWVESTLINIAKFRRGSFPQPYGLPKWYDDKDGIPFVQVFDVSDNLRLKTKTKNKISRLGTEQSVFIPSGTLIVTLQGSIGRVAITQYDAYIDRTLLLFEEFRKPTEKLFFAYVIQNLFEIEKEKAPGGIIKTITKEVLSDFKVKLPTLPEQQKIAACLSSLDELITAHSKKLDALKKHKKGLMQQLFPAEGQTVPILRFPEFSEAGEWVEKILGEIAKPVTKKVDGTDKVTVLTLSAEYGIISQGDYFGKKIAGENVERYIFIIKNDFVYNDRTTKLFTYGTIKRLSRYQSGMVSPIYKCFRFNEDESPIFWEWYFESGTHESQLHSLINEGARTGRFNISIQKFLSISVLVPTLPEQQKIAACLSSLDELITAQSQKLDALKKHKKGLMQQLFPAVGEE